MSWGIVAIGGMSVLGAHNANQQQKQQKKQNLAAAEHNRYSNWTGRTMQQRFDAPDALGGALQGGISGAGMVQGMGSVFGGASKVAPAAGASAGASTFANNPNIYNQGPQDFWGGSNPYANPNLFMAKK
jgi:hypothetical protein